MSDRPLVSIGLPVHNGAPFIRKALDSLLTQSYEYLEIVICDNASTDGTAAICTECAARDNRIRYYRYEQLIGARHNFNRTFSLATGDYFMWAAADDLRPPTVVKELLAALRTNPSAVMSHGPVLLDRDSRDELVKVPNTMDLSAKKAADRIRTFARGIQQNGIVYGLFRRDVLAQLKPAMPFSYGPEYLIGLQMCLRGPIVWIPSPMIIYKQKEWLADDDPMGKPVALTPYNLFVYRGVKRSKCWITLLLGCFYILTTHDCVLAERLTGVTAHVVSFVKRYWRHLGRQAVMIAVTPIPMLISELLKVRRGLQSLHQAKSTRTSEHLAPSDQNANRADEASGVCNGQE